MIKTTLVLVTLLSIYNAQIYDVFKSDVGKLTKSNWNSQVVKNQENGKIVVVHFYTENDGKSYQFSDEFNKKATAMKGIINFGFVNCTEQKKLCTKEKPTEMPGLKVYPPLPIPSVSMPLELGKAVKMAVSHIKAYVTEVNEDNVAGFLGDDAIVPKVLLFTDKKGLPLIYRALSNNFNNKMNFGIVRKDQEDLVASYKVKTFPKVILIKPGHKKPHVFDKEINFANLKEFLNIFSEQFVPKGNEKLSDTKPWLFEPIPEITNDSVKDVCTGLEKTLCVILFSPEKPSDDVINTLKAIKSNYENSLNSFSFKFSWINSSQHNDWVEKFNIEDKTQIDVRIFNPGRRKRFLKLESEFNKEAIEGLLEKLLGGDARFTPLRGDIPAFSTEI